MPDPAKKVAEEIIVRRFHVVLCDCSSKVCAAGQAEANVLRSEIVDALRQRDCENEEACLKRGHLTAKQIFEMLQKARQEIWEEAAERVN